ncbi:MAG: glycosyltransferase family 4 protein [Rickettsiaceae bacterium]|nr:glycosyltransferase family 4 protein [Rickettsiaceae bacterium]MDD9337165.1 glycosyltransferase family 4 protein [Rickettsiaceae bacterium]
MKKIIIFTNTDWHFYAHLLPIALTAKMQGYEVKVLTNISEFKDKIEQHGLQVIPISIKRGSINPFTDLLLLIKLISILNKEKPNILHNFTIKPIFYGSISAFLCNICSKKKSLPQVINTFVGMGLIFISSNFLLRLVRSIIVRIISIIGYYRSMLFVVQNDDDLALLVKLAIAPKNLIVKQCSVGIETEKFPFLLEPLGSKIVVALVARMIIDKGIYEFIYAAKILKQKGIDAEFWLVGEPDKDNKQSIAQSILEDYQNLGYIKYLGYQKNIEEIWKKAHIAVLPSYREGLSRSLLEAGAYGRAIITTDAPGGRELIQDQINGLLVKPQNTEDLARAMELLITMPLLRKHLGKKIRQDILEKYDCQLISEKMVNFYDYPE